MHITKITRYNNTKRAGQASGIRSQLTIPTRIDKVLREEGVTHVAWSMSEDGIITLTPVRSSP